MNEWQIGLLIGTICGAFLAWYRLRERKLRRERAAVQASLLDRCRALFAEERYDEAASLLAGHLEQEKSPSKSVRSWLAQAYYYSCRYADAVREFRTCLRDQPADHRSRGHLACALLHTGDRDSAHRELQAALAALTGTDRQTVLRWWGEATGKIADYASAIDAYKMLLNEAPSDFSARLSLARCLLQTGKTDLARQMIEPGLSRASAADRRQALLFWSGLAWKAGDFKAAVDGYRKLLADNPDDLNALHQYALLLASAPDSTIRDGRQAVEYARRVCERENWANWRSVSVLAAAYAETGDFDQAIHFAEVALQIAPEEEKQTRSERRQQYQRGEPYRIHADSPDVPALQRDRGRKERSEPGRRG
jgi:tetratricopeptide (TPR) repeat protein